MKFKFILCICFFVGMAVSNAQGMENKEGHKLQEEKGLAFPTTLSALTEIYGTGYEEVKEESTGENYYKWTFSQEVVLVFVPIAETEQYIGIVAQGEEPVGGLSYGLIFNQSTLEECRNNFVQYNPDWVKVTEEENEYYKLSFKKDNTYNYLYFYNNPDNKEVLKAMTISTMELD